jgi:hypothetical protein
MEHQVFMKEWNEYWENWVLTHPDPEDKEVGVEE